MIDDARSAETAAGVEPVAVPLADGTIHVQPVNRWRSSGLSALRNGDFERWAETCLTVDSLDTWRDIDPTVDDIEAMFEAWSELTGQTTGKSSASPRSSNATATRSKRTYKRRTA